MEPSTAVITTIQTMGAGGVVKVMVDLFKQSKIPTPSWSLPVLAFLFGQFAAFTSLVATGGLGYITWQSSAGAVWQGILATGAGIGIHELGQRSNEIHQANKLRAAISRSKEEAVREK